MINTTRTIYRYKFFCRLGCSNRNWQIDTEIQDHDPHQGLERKFSIRAVFVFCLYKKIPSIIYCHCGSASLLPLPREELQVCPLPNCKNDSAENLRKKAENLRKTPQKAKNSKSVSKTFGDCTTFRPWAQCVGIMGLDWFVERRE